MERIENSAIYCRPGFKPARVVIGKHGDGYATCLEILPPNEEPWRAHVHDGMSFDEALVDYQRRIEWLIGRPREGV